MGILQLMTYGTSAFLQDLMLIDILTYWDISRNTDNDHLLKYPERPGILLNHF